ncbi:MAG: capsid assembly protein [Geminicoccaceae bacterium]
MSEQQLQETEDAVHSESDVAAAPAAETDPDAVQQPKPSRPAGVPEKFWDGEAGCIRTDALLKSYLEIERKLGSMIALPADDGDSEGRGRLHRALGVPESPDDYQIAARSSLAEPSPEINAKLHAAGFTPQQAQLVYDLAADHLLPLVDELLDEFGSARDSERLANRFGGTEAWRALAGQIRTWGRANLSDEVFATLSANYDGVLAMHQMMQAREPAVLRDGAGAQPAPDESSLSQMMRDPRYWRDRDPHVVAKVTEGFQRLYPA